MEDKKILGPDGREATPAPKEVAVPEDIKKKIDEKRQARRELMNEFMDVSLQRALAVQREQELLVKIKNNTDALNQKIEYAYKKLKLDKDLEYGYSYRQDGKFVGNLKKKRVK